MISRMREYGWTGLNTQANATGLEPLECVEFQDLVVKGLDAQRRDGLSERIASFAGDETAMDFVAADSEHIAVPMDTVAWALGLKFTVQVLVELDGTGDNQAVFYAGATTPSMALDTLSGNWRWRVWDSAGTLSTVTVGTAAASLQSIMLVRDGASLTTRLNDVAGGTGTIVATLSRAALGAVKVTRGAPAVRTVPLPPSVRVATGALSISTGAPAVIVTAVVRAAAGAVTVAVGAVAVRI